MTRATGAVVTSTATIQSGGPPAGSPAPAHTGLPPRLAQLLDRVARGPYAFDLFHLLRHIDALCPERPRLGTSGRPVEDVLRIGQVTTMSFAPAALAELRPGDATAPLLLRTYLFGMFGPNGPLPLHLTEYAHSRALHYGDHAVARFVDVLHHRLATLFFRAWAASEPTVSHDRPQDDDFARQLASLAGYGMESLRDRDAMPDVAKLHFTGRLASHTRNPEGLEAILGSFFDVPVRVEEFVPGWVTLPAAAQCRLGEDPATGTLGSTATAGGRIRLHHHRFRLRIGPLTLRDYERLLPGRPSMRRLVPIVRNYAGDELGWSADLLLRHDEVPPTRLGQAGQLGWTSWIGTRRSREPAGDLSVDPVSRVGAHAKGSSA
jgi:type VI secretion system protein ImpH